jgi:hypothetical protein
MEWERFGVRDLDDDFSDDASDEPRGRCRWRPYACGRDVLTQRLYMVAAYRVTLV